MDTAAFRADLELIPETLDALADALDAGLPGLERLPVLGASRVLVLGMGSSRYAADVVARRYRAIGATVVVELASAELLPPTAPDLAVVAVSATGGSAEVLRAVERYRGTGRLVAVTNRPESELGRLADVVVPLLAGVEASGVACRTFRATFPVLDAVLEALLGTAPAARFDGTSVRAAAAATRALFATSAEWLPPVAELLAAPMGTWALAPAERASSAQQSALMLREVPRRAAYASETGDWSHVDVYLTKTQDYRALVFAGSVWDAQALDWMAQRGSRFASIGRDLPGAELTIRFPGDERDEVAALTEVLVGELVADRWLRA
ncbi:SIS domain-containing protein [Agromyces cerinus]|uniref:Glutamine--fructose-6-phosphate aminotransferase [isomerizing] n=1 Tax=Agromyces cerinus subsp. cerinus TaxID=232089 RepID=A0A1N6GDE1_9MICO|nr:SIS domain-containing protein [Agromyces cerinus]SIO05558.1 SIS domain-containing protein [Agromyces cerinus subsp. cerinus]